MTLIVVSSFHHTGPHSLARNTAPELDRHGQAVSVLHCHKLGTTALAVIVARYFIEQQRYKKSKDIKQAHKPQSYASLKLRVNHPPTHRGEVKRY